MKEEPRVDAKLKNLSKDQLDEMWRFRHPEEGGKKLSFEEILVEIPRLYGKTSSMGALSEFYSWLKFKRDLDEAFERSEQAQIELVLKNPEATPEALQAVGQLVFTSRAMQTGDIQGFVKLMTAWERRQQRIMDQEKWEDAKLTAQRKRETEDAIRNINSDKTLTAEQQREAVLTKMDEFFGIKKK